MDLDQMTLDLEKTANRIVLKININEAKVPLSDGSSCSSPLHVQLFVLEVSHSAIDTISTLFPASAPSIGFLRRAQRTKIHDQKALSSKSTYVAYISDGKSKSTQYSLIRSWKSSRVLSLVKDGMPRNLAIHFRLGRRNALRILALNCQLAES